MGSSAENGRNTEYNFSFEYTDCSSIVPLVSGRDHFRLALCRAERLDINV